MNNKGCIYILTNPSFPDLIKIGYADDVEERVNILNSNPGLHYSFRIYATYDVYYVDSYGDIYEAELFNNNVYHKDYRGVRPACWIKL